jgi:hypothetical protein
LAVVMNPSHETPRDKHLTGHRDKREEWQYRQVSIDERFHDSVRLVKIG